MTKNIKNYNAITKIGILKVFYENDMKIDTIINKFQKSN